jgi:DNA-binding NarL/FixJ family response regulator
MGKGGSMTALLVAERRDFVKAGIEALLKESGYLVVGEDVREDSLLTSSVIHEASVIILSQNVAEAGMHLPRQLKDRNPSLRIIALLESVDGESTFELVGPEVDGVIMRESSTERLLECVNSVYAGRRWLDPELWHRSLRPGPRATGNGALTAREVSISDLVARGLRNKQIARAMRISESTVKMHLHHIYGKLQLSGRTELALRTRPALRGNGHGEPAPK